MLSNQKPIIFDRSRTFYYRIIINAVIILTIIGAACAVFYKEYNDHSPVTDDFFEKWLGMAILASFFLFLLIGLFIKWLTISLRETRIIAFYADRVVIGDEAIAFSQIANIKVLDVNKIAYEPFYGATIYLLNAETKFIAELFYNKSPLLFQKLERLKDGHFPEKEKAFDAHTEIGEPERVDVSIFLSFEHISRLSLLLMIFLCVIKFALYSVYPVNFTYFLVFISIFFYYLVSQVSYYFIIDNHNLEIKNKFLFGFSRIYRLNEIKGAILHAKGVGRGVRYGLRIVLNDHTSHFFAANAFRKRKWHSLTDALRKRGIDVENKIYEPDN